MIYTGRFKRAKVYHNTLGETPEAIKAKTGCTTIINGILFNPDGSLCCDVRIDGKWIANDQYTYWGLGWSGDDIPRTIPSDDAASYDNFLSCVPVQPDIKRGRSAASFTGDTYTVLCVPDGSGSMTIPEADAAIGECDAYLILDGGGSAYCDCPGGKVDTTLARKTANRTYILIWEDTPVAKKRICLDPGHGLKELNQSPDGTYFEHEFTLDMGNRIRAHLLRNGMDVLLTREDSSTPTLTARAQKANAWGADLFVSLHSNAVAGGWNDTASGFTVWTYAPGGERDRAAKLLLAEIKAAGVKTFGSELYHSKFAVLAATNMPAMLPEYAFHTCRADVVLLKSEAHRAKLAEATAKAIVSWCGMAWVPEPVKEPEPAEDPNADENTIFRVQVGAFESEDNAKGMAEKLGLAGYKTIIKKEAR